MGGIGKWGNNIGRQTAEHSTGDVSDEGKVSSRETTLNNFNFSALEPTFLAITHADFHPLFHGVVLDLYAGAFMKDEKVCARGTGSALDNSRGGHDDGTTAILQLMQLLVGGDVGKETDEESDDSGGETYFLSRQVGQEEIGSNGAEHQQEGEQAEPSPSLDAQGENHPMKEGYEEHLAGWHDTIHSLGSRHLEVETNVIIGRIEETGAFVAEDGAGNGILTEIAVAKVVVELGAAAAGVKKKSIDARSSDEVLVGISGIGLGFGGDSGGKNV